MNRKECLVELCRLCTKSEENLIHLFADDSSSRNLVKIICERFELKVSESDSLPNMICLKCKNAVEEFESFRQSCVLAESFFQSSARSSSFNSSSSQGNDVTDVDHKQEMISVNDQVDPILQKTQNMSVTENKYEPEPLNVYPELSCYGTGCPVDTAQVKEPLQDDYILVKEESFTVNNWNKRLQNAFVEFSRSTITPSDRVLVENVKKREVLPQMWDVYEKQINRNIMTVVMRRYLISKGAFPCSLCNQCISLDHENVPVEDERLFKSYGTENEDSSTMTFEILDDFGAVSAETDASAPSFGNETNGGGPVSYETGDDNGEVIECEHCQKPFPHLHSLKRHLRTHSDYKTLPCRVCGKGFSRKEHLVRHMLLHTGGRPFECYVCKKTFTRKEHLTRHQSIHEEGEPSQELKTQSDYYSFNFDSGRKGSTGEASVAKPRAHECDICRSKFGRKEHLMRHLRRTHNLSYPGSTASSNCATILGEDSKPALTGKTATSTKLVRPISASGLMSEERTMYLCNLCPRSFSREEHLGRHLKIHVRDSMFVNESRVPGTDITLSLINAND